MKQFVSQFARLTSAVAAGLMCSSALVFAADETTPAPATQNAGAELDGSSARRRIQSMQAAIDQALAGQEKLF